MLVEVIMMPSVMIVSNITFYVSIIIVSLVYLGLLLLYIHKQKDYQKKVNLQYERIDQILNATHAGLFEWDYTTGKITLSDSFGSYIDTKQFQLNQLTIDDLKNFVYEDDRSSFISVFESMLGGHRPYMDFDCRMIGYDQNLVNIHIFSKIISKDAHGKPLKIVGIVNQVSSERQATKEVEQVTYLLKNIIENSNGGVAVFDRKMNYLYVSETYKKQFHLTESPIGKNHYQLFPDLPEKFKDAHRRSLKGEVLSQSKDTYLRSSGDQLFTNWSTRPWYDINGQIGGIISYVQVVTDQVQKEMKLEYASKHDTLTGLFNRAYFVEYLAEIDSTTYLPLGIMMMDLNGLKLINDAYGYQSGDEVIKLVGDKLKDCSKTCGDIFRLGGDEFAFIAVHTDEDQMRNYVRQVHEKVRELVYKNIKLSVSIGFSNKIDVKTSMRDILKEAESNLLKNKLLDSTSLRNSAINGILQTLTDKYEVEKTHSNRVQKLCLWMGEALNFDKEEMDELSYASILHDIGKIAIPDAILGKPAKLTDEEFEIMKTHTTKGYEILRAADEYIDLAKYALTHHERVDGSGYPNGLKGDQIPLISRIISIADSYEAMTADRPYRKAQPLSYAIDELNKYAGSQFDETLVKVFIEHVIPQEQNI